MALTINEKEQMYYTNGNTFRLSVSTEEELSAGTSLKFTIVSGDKNTVIKK